VPVNGFVACFQLFLNHPICDIVGGVIVNVYTEVCESETAFDRFDIVGRSADCLWPSGDA